MKRSQATDDPATIIERYPAFEGANILTGIGFKHLMYLGEEAILEHCRIHQLGPQLLYERYGLALEIVFADARLHTSVHIDDFVRIEVTDATRSGESSLCYDVRMFVQREDRVRKAVASTWKLVFRKDHGAATAPAPATVARYVVNEIDRASAVASTNLPLGGWDEVSEDSLVQRLRAQHPTAFVWGRAVPYFYCHYSKRLQYSGYLRLVEEVVELFLADRGLSIRSLFERRCWVPVVIDLRMEVLREVFLEEHLYTVFKVDGIYKNLTFSGSIDFYLVRNAEFIHAATGRITHAYLEINESNRWALVPLDKPTIAALIERKGV